MFNRNFVFTSESVSEGHPDKVADQVSDAVLDAALTLDPRARVACETLVKTGFVVLAGELTTKNDDVLPYADIVRKTINRIGYDNSAVGFDGSTCGVLVVMDRQSTDINMGVDRVNPEEQGAGDQGLMFGYACRETDVLMPMPIYYAHLLMQKLAELRHKKVLPWLRPDSKSQVTVRYENGMPVDIDTIVVSTQHDPEISQEFIHEAIREELIYRVIPSDLRGKKLKIHVNPTGRFVIGGPVGDSGLTGRKIIVDTYGGMGRHGGGAFSGKDPSKVDRSASYMGRYIAKNIVAAGLADRCEIQLAYAIGIAEPVSVMAQTFGTAKIDETIIEQLIREHFSLTPFGILKTLDLERPIYSPTAAYGHFGRPEFTWEKTDKVTLLRSAAGFSI